MITCTKTSKQKGELGTILQKSAARFLEVVSINTIGFYESQQPTPRAIWRIRETRALANVIENYKTYAAAMVHEKEHEISFQFNREPVLSPIEKKSNLTKTLICGEIYYNKDLLTFSQQNKVILEIRVPGTKNQSQKLLRKSYPGVYQAQEAEETLRPQTQALSRAGMVRAKTEEPLPAGQSSLQTEGSL